ncbi:flagellar basal body rod C-terminal domain-containing protein [Methylobacterium symbioticum]|uniref:flagellar basal body rod C-terminal domain-containing protein n=1 Tax=Methylobacterium symbioticum TaxID=2584084 RepID=UPI0011579B80|nr:flagellar basal body rod C-terminal domain-containing protein [Methylobacterium symbioticum]
MAETIGRPFSRSSTEIQLPGSRHIEQGNLKPPSVNPVTELAGSRVAMGAYQSNLKVIAALDDLNRRTVDLLKIRGESFA